MSKSVLDANIRPGPGGNLQPAWYRASTANPSVVLARHWHSAGISTAYQRRGSKLFVGTGAVLEIGTMPALKSVLVQYCHYSEIGCQPTLGLRTGAVLCQYRANSQPGTNSPV